MAFGCWARIGLLLTNRIATIASDQKDIDEIRQATSLAASARAVFGDAASCKSLVSGCLRHILALKHGDASWREIWI